MSSLLLSTLTAALVTGARPVINVQDLGASPAPGDDSIAINVALEQAWKMGGAVVYIPAGTYQATDLRIYGNTELVGDGPSTILQASPGVRSYMLSVNPGYSGYNDPYKADPSRNERNIVIRKIRFEDRVVQDGFDASMHLMNFNGVSTLRVEDCEITGFRGDGIYLGSGNVSNQERHNEDIIIRRCLFDGINKTNRNAITIIDGTRVSISDCTVTRTTGSTSPGQFDIEPNKYLWHRVRDVRIVGNTFVDNGGRAAIIMDVPFSQTQLQTPIQNLAILDNKITGSQLNAILVYQVDSPSASTPYTGVEIAGNEIRNVTTPIAIEGVRGIRIHDNKSYDTGNGYALGYGPLGRGLYDASVFDNLIVRAGRFNNNYAGSAFAIMNVTKLDLFRNTAIDIYRPDNKVGCFAMLRGGQNGGASKSLTISGNNFGWYNKTVRLPEWVKVLAPHVTDPATQVVNNNITIDVPYAP